MFMKEEGSTLQKISRKRWGDEAISFTKVKLDKSTYKPEDTYIELELQYEAKETVIDPVFGMAVKNSGGTTIMGTNTVFKHVKTGQIKAGQKGAVRWKVLNVFNDGEYSVDIAISHSDALEQHDWWEDAATFTVYREEHTPFAVEPPVEVTLE